VAATVAMAAGTLVVTEAVTMRAATTAGIMVTTRAATTVVIMATTRRAVTSAAAEEGTGLRVPATLEVKAVQAGTRSGIKPHGITGLAAVAGADGVAAGADGEAGSDRCSGRFF
jgi:hypothetical protein